MCTMRLGHSCAARARAAVHGAHELMVVGLGGQTTKRSDEVREAALRGCAHHHGREEGARNPVLSRGTRIGRGRGGKGWRRGREGERSSDMCSCVFGGVFVGCAKQLRLGIDLDERVRLLDDKKRGLARVGREREGETSYMP